jgi:hypothetical protein
VLAARKKIGELILKVSSFKVLAAAHSYPFPTDSRLLLAAS